MTNLRLLSVRTTDHLNPLKPCLSSVRSLGLAACVLISGPSSISWAEESSPAAPPPVFHSDEIQHGFAEFDTPPDFFSDDLPAPYDTYSNSPNLPSSDHKPGGVFQNIVFAEDIDDEQTLRRGHIYTPINSTDSFPPSTNAVYMVFSVFKHYAPYQIIGQLFPESVEDSSPSEWLDEDRAELATEDESGFLKFFPPAGQWKPGQYRVEIYMGYVVNTNNKMGTMRFTIRPSTPLPLSAP